MSTPNRRYRWRLLDWHHTPHPSGFQARDWPLQPDRRAALRASSGFEADFATRGEWEQILHVMHFVHGLSAHQGWVEAESRDAFHLLEGARSGHITYRCVEFAWMLHHLLTAWAIPSRVVGLLRATSEAGLGQGHVVVEAWCNRWGKWVVLDPQFDRWYQSRAGMVLSALDVHDRVVAGHFEDIVDSRRAALAESYTPMDAQDNQIYDRIDVPDGFERDEVWASLPERSDFESFLRHWLGYYRRLTFAPATDLSGLPRRAVPTLLLHDPGDTPPAVFQRSAVVYHCTTDRHALYAPVNGVDLMLVPEAPDRLRIQLRCAMPWFDHYRVEVDGHIGRTRRHHLRLRLHRGSNRVRVAAVNDQERSGPPSSFTLDVG